MMSPQHEVLDISSDDEDEELGLGERPDWLASLLEKDDSDEVIVIGEVHGSQEQSSKLSVKEDLDDECLILDGDPDKPVEVENDAGNESDELQVVGEKGQVACRDYPHPRHLCAKFPFSSNPHEKYCDLCHCYVCETRAPCVYWGTGVSTSDHCHCNDEEIWKLQRKWFKQGAKAPLPPPKHPTTPVLHTNRIISLRASKSNNVQVCIPMNNISVPSIISQRNHHHGPLPSGSSSIVNNNVVHQRHKGSVGNTLGPRFVSSHTNFKRVGASAATITKNRPSSSSSTNQVYHSCTLQQLRNHSTTTLAQSGGQSPRSHELRACQQQRKNHPSVTYQVVPVHQQINSHAAVTYNGSIQSPRPEEVNYTSQQQQQRKNNTQVTYNGTQSPRPEEVSTSQPQQLNNQTAVAYNVIQSPRSQEVNTFQSGGLMESPLLSQAYSPPTVTNQNMLDVPMNWLGDTVDTFAPPPRNPSLVSTSDPISQSNEDLDLERWIQSIDPQPEVDDAGKESISSGLSFVPSQIELAEAMLLFDFENPYANV